ncbi:lytic transglycosylase domain-containing protein [Massilia sp. YIM B02443]|uniref:lytic transglycosylase domain-containing protein n=1 Tax=Massilia sp. YIM B02443 TaxID=3050127 RepID=UPI0025B659C1|nr:transglycosylase SLT domain-containing protein [Massilia sp. YIM B02443]MDN4037930.1 transglycosylase SLT domain-containing protein [Massilia sp. YIM B02443]
MFQSKLSAGAIPAAIALVLSCALPPAALAQEDSDAPAPEVALPPVPAGAPSAPSAPAMQGLPPAPNDARADDDNFMLLREASRQNDGARANAIASRLAPNYLLAPYVDYYRLKPRLREAIQDEVLQVLRRHEGTAVADRLRNDWLVELGKRGEWNTFLREVGSLGQSGDLQVRCYALLARASRGEAVAQDARALLVNPPSYGDGCAALIAELARNGQFTQADLLRQLRLAGETNATGPARRTAVLLGLPEARATQAVDLPAVAMARGVGKTRAEQELYLVAVGRMARTSLKLAAVGLEKNGPKLDAEERAIGWANVALAASIALAPEADEYWRRAKGAPLSDFQMQWQTRMALRRGDWKEVRASIEAMPPALRGDSTWVYWLGRAHQAEGRSVEARDLFGSIAAQSTFYGQLAQEELGRLVVAPPPVAPITAAELAQASANPSLQRALKFYSLSLRAEGNREWNWGLRNLSERQLLAAAELARRNELLDRMVETSLRTRTELSYDQRFPAPHLELLKPTAQGLGLDKAWVYGLIRQESRFIRDARSGVGASGLMQVMPATGKWVANKIGLDNFVHDMLNDIRTNITLGANYMNMVLGNFDGSYVLATAAYNAGPGRSRTWRGRLDKPMEGAIFVETIPFTETRGYVRNVMANATNYASIFEGKPQSLKARLGTISPRGGSASVLD